MHHSTINSPRPASGHRLVLAIFALALAASAFAWWWNFNRGRRALEFYGPEAATLIRTAPAVEILRAEPEKNIDIGQAPGLINARASLLSDASYEWSAADPRQESPRFSVRFARGEQTVTLTFDFEHQTVATSSTGRVARLTKKTAAGWQQYLARHLTATLAPSSATAPP